jgi:hypothetical protein
MACDQEVFCHVSLDYLWQQIDENAKHKCVHGTFNRGATRVVEGGYNI